MLQKCTSMFIYTRLSLGLCEPEQQGFPIITLVLGCMYINTKHQGLVVQRADSVVCFVYTYCIHWIAKYPVDSVIHPLNNWGQGSISFTKLTKGKCNICTLYQMYILTVWYKK